ncbi:MAG: formate dehydrogenase iron-sulfur subunit [Motiliproteus sp.]|jgi:formate dehydrogenase iron-sulfur subunit
MPDLLNVTVYIPRDTTALSLGANQVATELERQARKRGDELQIVRNGSRGLFWLEPLLEVETPEGRVAYGPVTSNDIPALLEAGMLSGAREHPLCLGLTEEIPYLKSQQRLTFARAGITDPLSLDDYLAHAGFQGLKKALASTSQAIVDEVKKSGLRGRGGAAFPTGIKWQTVLDAPTSDPSAQKYIVCNADEGDSGTFADRLLMEADPYLLIEGMCIAGLAVGATQGYIYLRSEYPQAQLILNQAIELATAAGYLGDDLCGSGQHFRLEVRLGAGAYICGEETSLLESLEGKRGLVRAKPPLPALVGLFGRPTVVNNVLSLAAIPYILAEGGQAYADFGMGRSRGTLAFQLAGNTKRGGLIELAFGTSLRTLLQDYGQGSASGRPLRAVQVGGPLGAYLPESQWDTLLDYEAFAAVGAVLGHGGIVVFDDSVDMAQQARFAMEFCVVESCGKCTPCRIGSTRGVEVIDRIIGDENRDANLALLNDLCDTLEFGSLCAMGGMTPNPVRSALAFFPDDFLPKAAAAEQRLAEENDHA